MTPSDFILRYRQDPKAAMTSLRYTPELILAIYAQLNLSPEEYPIGEAVWLLLHPTESVICPICTTQRRKFYKVSKGYAKTCLAQECNQTYRSQLNRQSATKINWQKSNQRREQTCIERYGAISNLSSGTQSRASASQRLLELYGVSSPLQNPDFMAKRAATTIARHGTLDFITSDKAKSTMIDRWGTDQPMHNEQLRDRVQATQQGNKLAQLAARCQDHSIEIVTPGRYYLDIKCHCCGTQHSQVLRQTLNILLRQGQSPCQKCNPINHYRSKGEADLAAWLQDIWHGEVHTNRKYLGPEIDIIIPDLKLCIEYNGVYWHSELRKPKSYHMDKKRLVESLGYDLIQIWEDHWQDPLKQAIIKSKLLHRLGLTQHRIGARKCRVVEVSADEAQRFMLANHLYGHVPSTHRLGLMYDNQLVMLCTFGRPRKSIAGNTQAPYELLRMASLMDHAVAGGFAKILKAFRGRYRGELMTYADCDWASSIQNGYATIGFELVKWTDPGYHWVVQGIRHNRMSFMRNRIPDIVPGQTVDDYMLGRGHVKAWNSGNFLYRLV